MKKIMRPLLVLFGLGVSLLFVTTSGVGGCGTAGSAAPPINIPGVASVDSLSTVPNLDISNLDYSQSSSSSASLSAGLVLKHLGDGFNQVGSASRAGCESNMHKKEMIRHSQESQLDRCYPEAIEAAGVVTIPSGSYGYFRVSKPGDFSGSTAAITADGIGEGPCAGIPPDHTEEIAACEAGTEGPGGGEIKLRIGRFDNELRIDMCEGDAGLVNEGTYSASDSVYTIASTRIGRFNGHNDKNTFSATIDLGTTGSVTDGIVDLGDGLASADAQMSGGFGSGSMHFEAVGSDRSNIIRGIFNGGFNDSESGKATSFTGRVFTHFGGTSNVGTAKFEFTGTPPPMPLSNMIPFNIPSDQMVGFLDTLSMQLGISIDAASIDSIFMCTNPDFDPEDPSAAANEGVAPMVQAGTDGCPEVTHTGVESFSIANGDDAVGDVSTKTQVFTIIDNSESTFFTEVNAFDLSTIVNASGTIAFARNWDCTPEVSFTDVDFATMTDAQKAAVQTGISSCRDLETKVRANVGMGGHNCNEQQQRGDMNNLANNGPPPRGLFGGNCHKTTTTCVTPTRDTYFFNPKDPDNNQYCLVSMGGCIPFEVISDMATGISDPDGVTQIYFQHPGGDVSLPANTAQISLNIPGEGTCSAECALQQPDFSAPTFDPTATDAASGGPPAACVTAFGEPPSGDPSTDPAVQDWKYKCQGLCSTKPDACPPPEPML